MSLTKHALKFVTNTCKCRTQNKLKRYPDEACEEIQVWIMENEEWLCFSFLLITQFLTLQYNKHKLYIEKYYSKIFMQSNVFYRSLC